MKVLLLGLYLTLSNPVFRIQTKVVKRTFRHFNTTFLHFFLCWEPISTCLDPNPIRVRILNTGLIVVKYSSKCRVYAGSFGLKNKNKMVPF
jgi:hypothetical protein